MLLTWDPQQGSLRTAGMFDWERDPVAYSPFRSRGMPLLAADPEGRCVAFLLGHGKVRQPG